MFWTQLQQLLCTPLAINQPGNSTQPQSSVFCALEVSHPAIIHFHIFEASIVCLFDHCWWRDTSKATHKPRLVSATLMDMPMTRCLKSPPKERQWNRRDKQVLTKHRIVRQLWVMKAFYYWYFTCVYMTFFFSWRRRGSRSTHSHVHALTQYSVSRLKMQRELVKHLENYIILS